MKYLNPKNIKHLTLISSESCNLKCSYCELAKSVAISYNKEQAKQVKENLKNGMFLENIKNIINRFNIDPKQIIKFDLWGQEPTLTLNEVNLMLPAFFDFFPNLNSSMFSSNMVQYPERIFEYINTIENICKTNNKRNKFRINIQMSFDGYENTKKFRGIEPDIILNNIKTLIEKLNEIELNYCKVSFSFNNVITKEEVLELNTYEKIKNYWEELYNITKYYIGLNKNPSIIIRKHFGCGPETPVNATKEQGLAFANFLKISKQINENYNYLDNYKRILQRLNQGCDIVKSLKFKSFEECFEYLSTYDIDNKFIEQLSKPLFCGPNLTGLKIRYDGSLIHCHHTIHHTNLETLNQKIGWKYDNLRAFAINNYYPNAINDSLENLDEYFYKFNTIMTSSYIHTYSLIVKLMEYLVNINQISEIYKNKENIFKHAFLIIKISSCLDANMYSLGSGAGSWIGVIRFYCNGICEFLDKEQKLIQEYNKEKI